MTLVLELPPDVRARLDAQAAERGVEPSEYALQLLRANLSAANGAGDMPTTAALTNADSPNAAEDPTLALFQQWREEREAMTPEELAGAEAEWEELKTALNATRVAAGSRLLFP